MAITLTTIKEPSGQGGRKLSSPLSPTLALAVLLLPQCAAAAEWRVTPTLTVRETYTDNVRLAAPELAQSDFITEISPGIVVTGVGPSLKLRAAYSPRYLKYARDAQGSALDHMFDGNVNAELIKNLFFLDAYGSVGQQNISAIGPQPIDNTNVTGNRTTVRSYTLSPYLRHDFGSTAAAEARYTHSATSTSASTLANGQNDALLLNLNSGPAFQKVGWGLRYTKQKFDNSGGSVPSVDSDATLASLRYMVTPQFYLTGTGGYETYDYASTGGATSGQSYSGGFDWRPSARTSISASAGHRFFGRTYSLDSSVRSRATVWQLSYNEDITTAQAQAAAQAQTNTTTSDFLNQLFLSSIPDATARQQAVDRFIQTTGLPPTLSRSNNFFSNQFLLQKTARGSVALIGARNTVVFTLYNTVREEQTAYGSGLGALGGARLNGNTRQTGADAMWSWRMTPFTSANFSTAYNRTRLLAGEGQQVTKLARVTLAQRIRPGLDGFIELRRQMGDTNALTGSYVENAVSAFVSMKF